MQQNAGNGEFAPWQDPQQKPLISFDNVTKKFGGFTAIDSLDLKIYEREFFALLGPSGCGKTTLMRMLAGFEAPTGGQIFLDGQDISPVPPNRRPVNMMFQSFALFPHLNVYDNIAFGLRRDRLDKARLSARVDEMLRLTRLEKFARRKPHQISGGQRQRVALARALARAPKLLLLDEPMGALDKRLRHDTQFELMDIQEKTGTTFVIVTHDQEEAMTVASRVAVMDHGKLIQVSTPADIYEEPGSVYVADFIGEVNIIEGTASAMGDDRYRIDWAEGQAPVETISKTPIAPGARVFFAIRPEKVAIGHGAAPDSPNSFSGKVIDIAYLGNISTYHVALGDGRIVKAQTSNRRRLARRGFTWDDQVHLTFTDTAGVVLTH